MHRENALSAVLDERLKDSPERNSIDHYVSKSHTFLLYFILGTTFDGIRELCIVK